MGYAVGWALGIGAGAVAAGAFIGFLVNGPPGRSPPPPMRSVADVAPPTPRTVAAETTAPSAVPPPPADSPPQPAKAEASATARPLPPIPPPSRSEPVVAAAPALATAEVREVQGRLRAAGFNPGPVDGDAGPQTATALKQYQEARGLAADGVADKAVLDRLRQEPTPYQAQAQTQAPRRPPPRYVQSSPPPPPPQRRDPLLESIERLFRR